MNNIPWESEFEKKLKGESDYEHEFEKADKIEAKIIKEKSEKLIEHIDL